MTLSDYLTLAAWAMNATWAIANYRAAQANVRIAEQNVQDAKNNAQLVQWLVDRELRTRERCESGEHHERKADDAIR